MASGTYSAIERIAASSLISKIALVLAGSLALALSAQIKVPFWPVPMTMQTFIVMMIGVSFGPRLAASTGAAYFVEGLIGQGTGVPVFASVTGFAGPTGGYLAGFFVSSVFIASAIQRGYADRLVGLLAVLVIGETLLFAIGWAWLTNFVDAKSALFGGVVNFLPAEALKIALVMAAARALSAKR